MKSQGYQPQGFFFQEEEPPELPGAFPPAGFVPGPSSVQGIEVYMPAVSTEKRPDIVDFKCPKCGATTAYSVDEGRLACEHCGFSEAFQPTHLGGTAESFEFDIRTVERSEKGWGEDRKELSCQNCGGVVSTSPDVIAFSCPFCGSNKVLFREPLEDVLRPRYLIPFNVSPEDCRANVQKWLGGSWMLPPELLDFANPEKFHPIYIPYWIFNANCNAVWHCEIPYERNEYEIGPGNKLTPTAVEWKEEEGKLQKRFEGLFVPGTTHLNMTTLGQVDYFKIEELVLYEPRYLAGMQAHAYNLPLDEAWHAGRQIMRERTRQACLDRINSSNVRNFNVLLDFCDEQWRYTLVPIYTSVYHYQDKTFQILVNGQTGRVAGPRPVDWEKIWMVIAGVLSPGLLFSLIGWFFSTGTSWSVYWPIGIALLATGLVIAFSILHRAKELEHV